MTTNPIKVTMQDYYNLAGYSAGAFNNHTDGENLGSILGGAAIFAGGSQVFQGGKWLWQHRANPIISFRAHKLNQKALYESLKDGNFFKTTRNHYNYKQLLEIEQKLKPITEPANLSQLSQTKQAKYAKKLYKSEMYDAVRDMIEEAKGLKGKELAKKLKEIDKATAQVRYDMHVQRLGGAPELQAVTKRGKAWAGVKKYTGFDKVSTGSKYLAKNSKIVRNLGKLGKGGGAMAAITLALEAPELYETYKKCGASKGTKQLGKTAVVVGAEVAGYAAGTAIGAGAAAAAGAAAGAALGSVVPIIGNIVGAVVGIGCGLLGSWLAGKGARAIVGKSELTKAKEEDARKLALEAKDSEAARKELMETTGKKLAEADPSDENAKKALKSYEKIIDSEEYNLKIKLEKQEILSELDALSQFKISNYSQSNYASQNMFSNMNFQMPNMSINPFMGALNNSLPNNSQFMPNFGVQLPRSIMFGDMLSNNLSAA